MRSLLAAAAAAGVTLLGTAAMAQPYGYGGFYDYGPSYGYGYSYDDYSSPRHMRSGYRDSDRDGIPDRAEWGRDRDHDGRPDQWDRYDNRRSYWRHRHDDDRHRYRYGYDQGYGWRY